MNVVWAEWIRLSEPRLRWGLTAALVVLTGFAPALTFMLLARQGSVIGFAEGRLVAADFAGAGGPALVLARVALLPGLFAGALAAYQLGADLRDGTVRWTLLREPRRLRVLYGRQAAIGAVVLLQASLALGAALAVAWLRAPSAGVDTSAWGTAEGAAGALLAGAAALAAALGCAALGASLATLLRSALSAWVAAAAWGIVEGMVAMAGVDPWGLPGHAIAALARGGSEATPLAEAAALVLGWCLVLEAAAGWSWWRRDVLE
jgi:hypothetical protein